VLGGELGVEGGWRMLLLCPPLASGRRGACGDDVKALRFGRSRAIRYLCAAFAKACRGWLLGIRAMPASSWPLWLFLTRLVWHGLRRDRSRRIRSCEIRQLVQRVALARLGERFVLRLRLNRTTSFGNSRDGKCCIGACIYWWGKAPWLRRGYPIHVAATGI